MWKQSNETNYFKNKLMSSSVAYMFCPSKYFLWDHQSCDHCSYSLFQGSTPCLLPQRVQKKNEKNTWVPLRENCYSNENLVLNVKCTTCMCFHNDGYMRLPFSSFPYETFIKSENVSAIALHLISLKRRCFLLCLINWRSISLS